MDINITEWINEHHNKATNRIENRPEITLSFAQSLDGSFTRWKGSTSSISSEDSTVLTHKLRALHAAIMIGSGTLLADNPQLTVRFAEGANPIPVLLDTHLSIPLDARILQNSSNLFIFCSKQADKKKYKHLVSLGSHIFPLQMDKSGLLPLNQVLKILNESGVTSLMVEGGPKLIHSLLTRNLWDLAVITVAPFWMGGYGLDQFEFNDRVSIQRLRTSLIGQDLIMFGSRI